MTVLNQTSPKFSVNKNGNPGEVLVSWAGLSVSIPRSSRRDVYPSRFPFSGSPTLLSGVVPVRTAAYRRARYPDRAELAFVLCCRKQSVTGRLLRRLCSFSRWHRSTFVVHTGTNGLRTSDYIPFPVALSTRFGVPETVLSPRPEPTLVLRCHISACLFGDVVVSVSTVQPQLFHAAVTPIIRFQSSISVITGMATHRQFGCRGRRGSIASSDMGSFRVCSCSA